MNQKQWQHVRSYETQPASPCMILFNGGSCAGCDLEIAALSNPRYESSLSQLGLRVGQAPADASMLLCTGVVTRQAEPALRRIHAEMKPDAQVVAVGTCAIARNIFRDCYNVVAQVDEILPVDLYIPGCPPRPAAIIAGLRKLQVKSWQRTVKMGPVSLVDGDPFSFQNGANNHRRPGCLS